MEEIVNEKRHSNIELYRIITMMIIVMHHYVVNSGLIPEILASKSMTFNNIFLLLFGWGGKTGINCFVLITGYFMCKSTITINKFLKLLLEVEFYKILFYVIFLIFGYSSFSVKNFVKMLLPVYSIGTGFTNSFIVFYLFIPFINKLIHVLTKEEHLKLIGLSLLIYTIIPSFFKGNVTLSYVTWFIILYFISSYIRLYPNKLFGDKKLMRSISIVTVCVSWLSIVMLYYLGIKMNKMDSQYYFVVDSNKILALLTAVVTFLYFKNINIEYNKTINTIAASTFGVLLIHANSDTMRQWLWRDLLQNTAMYNSNFLVIHAILSVLVIYIICTIIDMGRIKYVEKPFFEWLDKKFCK